MKKIMLLMIIAIFALGATKSVTQVQMPVQTAKIELQKESVEGDVQRSDIIPTFSSKVSSQFIPVAYGDATKIAFSNGISFDTKTLGKNGEPDLPVDLKTQYRDDETGYYIVQFSGPIYGPEKDWLESQGAKIHFYIPNYGFVVSIKGKTPQNAILANPAVNWMGIYQPAYKLSTLFDRVGTEHKVTILLFNDADMNSTVEQIKAIAKNNEVVTSDNGINKMVWCVINKTDINRLANIKEVYWIEPYIQPVMHNQQYQWVVQCGYLATAPGGNDNTYRRMWAMGIYGQGEIINHCDSGINTQHYMHRAGSAQITTWGVYPTHNKIVAYDSGAPAQIVFGDGSGASYHGTHTGCTTAGNDTTLGTDYRDGIAKMARLYHNDCGDNTSSSIYTFGDLNDLYIRPYNKYYASHGIRAYLSTNSWGADAGGAYTSMCLNVDQFMWSHKDFLLFFSNGNAGGVNTVGSPAAAKNCVSVGGTYNSTSCRTYYTTTSRGPTDDNRIKPTILTPGVSISSATTGTTGFSGMSGTSMASPGACGAGALVRQYLREGWYPTGKKVAGNAWSYISAAMIKAILINCADPNITGYTVPDNNVGWGRVDLDSTLYFAGDTRKTLLLDDTIGVLTGERKDYRFNVPSGATNLKITVVWTDYPGNPAANKQIVNDLDLYVQIGSTYYRGNQYSGGYSVANPAGRDSLNVEECARIASPTAGDWLVRIEGRNVPYGPQPYALVITYSAATVAGVVSTDKPAYRANDFIIDTVRVRVEDPNYGAVGIRDTVRVVLTGKYIETQPETLKCVELAESAYVFKGEMPLLFRGAVHGDGRLSVCQGDTIYVSYTDNNPSYISTTWAAVDAWYFTISDVHCENIDATSVDVCWTTNEGANSKIYYGTNPSNLNLVAQVDTPYCMPHRVKLTGLTPNTIYYYDVESKDFRGNAVRDNNGGAHYTFKTKAQAGIDVLVVLLNNNLQGTEFAHPDFMKNALNAGGWTYNWWSTKDQGQYRRDNLKWFKAVYFQVGQENYPVWTVAQKETIKTYHNGGARFAMTGHDIGWDTWQYSRVDTLFAKDYLHFRYIGDITATSWTSLRGIAGDPISGNYTGGVVYQPFRQGAAGDSIRLSDTGASGTGTYVWHGNVANDSCGIKWESTNNMGTPGDGVWGGQRTRVVTNCFEITQIDTTNPNSTTRTDILNNMFIWLIGHDHPDVTISSPVGGQTYTSSPISIAWTATAYGGAQIDTTWIEYSPDGGSTWYLITSGTNLTSPYSWNISALQNGTKYRVRVTVNDKNVYPSMKGFAETGNFRINIAGNDDLGPKVIPNSIVVANNPKFVTATDTLLTFTAVVSDSETGLSTIGAASYIVKSPSGNSSGEVPMQVVDGAWDEIVEDVIGSIRLLYTPGVDRVCSLFVRGRDNATFRAQNWGAWYYRTFTLINGDIRPNVGIEEANLSPLIYNLSNPMPNPTKGMVRINYAIPKAGRVTLKIYNCLGQVVRTLVDVEKEPGFYSIIWDGKDDAGRKLSAGIYFYQMSSDNFVDTKKTVLLK
ncbi:MAG: S8 family serine peptidase [candidate division WOR-3 bacterium]